MKLLTILLITWIDGSQSGFEILPPMICGDMMDQAIAIAKAHAMEYEIMECIYTDQIVVSPRPPKRPEGL